MCTSFAAGAERLGGFVKLLGDRKRLFAIKFREARQQALVSALREASDKGLSHQQLKSILLDPETDYARTFEVERIVYWQAYALTVEEISGWLSKAQLRHAIARLQKYSRSIAGLRMQDPEDS